MGAEPVGSGEQSRPQPGYALQDRLHGPIRMCAGCRERASRSVLLRVVAAGVDGVWSVVPDPQHRGLGRGASLHRSLACFELAERRRAFPRALRRSERLNAAPVREYLVGQGVVQ